MEADPTQKAGPTRAPWVADITVKSNSTCDQISNILGC